jgi:hypothetical protein
LCRSLKIQSIFYQIKEAWANRFMRDLFF